MKMASGTRGRRIDFWAALVFVVVSGAAFSAVVGLASLWSSVRAASPALPPRPPTPTPTLVPSPTPLPGQPPFTPRLGGGWIELRVRFSPSWPWDRNHWQELWSVVQWKDERGYWRDVAGWQGGLNTITIAADGTVIGKQGWWVTKGDLGGGPFRWRVFRSRGGRVLATSEPFYLPDRVGESLWVEVSLGP